MAMAKQYNLAISTVTASFQDARIPAIPLTDVRGAWVEQLASFAEYRRQLSSARHVTYGRSLSRFRPNQQWLEQQYEQRKRRTEEIRECAADDSWLEEIQVAENLAWDVLASREFSIVEDRGSEYMRLSSTLRGYEKGFNGTTTAWRAVGVEICQRLYLMLSLDKPIPLLLGNLPISAFPNVAPEMLDSLCRTWEKELLPILSKTFTEPSLVADQQPPPVQGTPLLERYQLNCAKRF